MKPGDFKRWRKSLSLSQKDAAEALGLKRRVVQYYEKGERNGEAVKIPKTVQLACWAITQGQVEGWHGPERLPDKGKDRKDKSKADKKVRESDAEKKDKPKDKDGSKGKHKHKDKAKHKDRAKRRKGSMGSSSLKHPKGNSEEKRLEPAE